MYCKLRPRLKQHLSFRLRILDDGNGDSCNKRASIPLSTSLDRDFYLRLHCLEIPSAVKFANMSTRNSFATLFPLEARICRICFSIALFSRRRRIISFSSLGHITSTSVSGYTSLLSLRRAPWSCWKHNTRRLQRSPTGSARRRAPVRRPLRSPVGR